MPTSLHVKADRSAPLSRPPHLSPDNGRASEATEYQDWSRLEVRLPLPYCSPSNLARGPSGTRLTEASQHARTHPRDLTRMVESFDRLRKELEAYRVEAETTRREVTKMEDAQADEYEIRQRVRCCCRDCAAATPSPHMPSSGSTRNGFWPRRNG